MFLLIQSIGIRLSRLEPVAEDVDMVHRLFGHCNSETLISLSSSPSVSNIPVHLSAASIHKHFPFSCPDCPLGNLQRRRSQYSAPSEPSTIGVEWEVHFKEKWTGPDDRPSPTFQQQLYLFTAVDSSSKFIFAQLCRNSFSVTSLGDLRVLCSSF